MADVADKAKSGIEKVQKKNPFDSEDIRKGAWAKAEKSIANGKPEGALLVLQVQHASSWLLVMQSHALALSG